jgi:hypothetical protein
MWVRQGRTDAWIAHKLDVSVDELGRFKREHALDEGDDVAPGRPADPLSVPPPEPRSADTDTDEEDEDDADEPESEPSRERSRSRSRSRRRPRRPVSAMDDDEEAEEAPAPPRRDEDDEDDAGDGGPPRRRRRGRRGGRRHRGRRPAFEATFDHGDEGYGLWLDPAVVDNPVYSEHWAGHRAVTVTFDAESITIRRADPGARPEESDTEDED